MKLSININSGNSSFKGLRQDRRFVKQLATEQKISLTENNQKNIIKSIENISKHGSESGTKFLLDVAKNIKYATNINFNINPKNKWMAILMMATASSAVNAGVMNNKDIASEFNNIFYKNNELSEVETNIMKSYENIHSELAKISTSDTDFETIKANLEYFIISSETSIDDKRYILEKLEYFLSDDYKINPQLKNHKFQVLSEIVNDIALDSVTKNEPNIKAQNQRQFGICTSISIGRKLLAYEYKRDFVDTILSELDDSEFIQVYDRKQLGKGVKISVPKLDVDFTQAINTGYRIIDISVSNWMNYSDMEQNTGNLKKVYVGFDGMNFDSYRDSHVKILSPETGVANEHEYYQALSVAGSKLNSLKESLKEESFKLKNSHTQADLLLAEEKGRYINTLKTIIEGSLADDYKEKSRDILIKVLGLKHKNSDLIEKDGKIAKEYLYLPNEEVSIKKAKIKNFLNDGYSYALSVTLTDEKLDQIYELTEVIQSIDSPKKSNKFALGKQAIDAANSFRNQVIKACSIPSRLQSYQISLGLEDEDTSFLKGINKLIKMVEKGNEFIIADLCAKNGVAPSKKDALEFLNSCKDYVENLPALYDNFYKRMNLGDKYSVFLNELKTNKEILESGDDEKIYKAMVATGIFDLNDYKARVDKAIALLTHSETIQSLAEMFGVANDKDTVLQTLCAIIAVGSTERNPAMTNLLAEGLGVPEEEVFDCLLDYAAEISGHFDMQLYKKAEKEVYQFSIKNDFIKYWQALIKTFENGIDEEFLTEFLINNGEEPGFEPEKVQRVIDNLLQDINNMAITVNTIASALHIEDKNGDIIHSIYPVSAVVTEFEKAGYILKPSEMQMFKDKFDTYAKLTSEKELYSKDEYKRKVKEAKAFSKKEKELINMILNNANQMSKTIDREKKFLIRDLKPKFEEVYREFGVNSGQYWVGLTPGSGANSPQEVAMLEAVTGKPYYIETNLKKGFEKIKNGKHSGISTTSVSDKEAGWHAQYITSIETVKVPSKKDPSVMIEKDILFHDNTWGKSEKENVWVDSRGQKRTDYEGEYGYKYGYVTDEKLRNGTFTNDLLTKKGQISLKDRNARIWQEGYSFDLMPDIILQGTTNKALNVVKQLKDALFIDEYDNLEVLEEAAKKMPTEELQHKLYTMNNIKLSYPELFNDYINKIKGNEVEPGISSLEEYNALPTNSPLKLALEKAALRETFPQANYLELIENIESMQDLENVRAELFNNMRQHFAYSFNKDLSLVNYFISEKNKGKFATQIIVPVLTEAGITPSNQEFKKVFVADEIISEIAQKGFDGSLGSFARSFAQVVTNKLIDVYGEQISVEEAKSLRENIYNYVVDELLVKLEDVESHNISKETEKIIDTLFNPESDEEFVKIYRTLQGYTSEEFDRKIMSQLTEELLIAQTQNVTGYELVQAIRAEKEDAEDDLFLELYLDEYQKVYEQNELEPFVRYEKYSNKITAQLYKEKKFDDTYLHLKYTLGSLNYKKMFNKVKQQVLDKYNMLPAYPHLKAMDDGDGLMLESLDAIKSAFKRVSFLHNQHEIFGHIDSINEFAKTHLGQSLTPADVDMLVNKLRHITQLAGNDNTFKTYSISLMPLADLKEGDTIDSILPAINEVVTSSQALQDLQEMNSYDKKIEEAEKNLKNGIEIYLRLKVQPEYRSRVNAKLNEWLRAMKIERNTVAISVLEKSENEEINENLVENVSENLKEPPLEEPAKSKEKDSLHKTTERIYNELIDMTERYHLFNAPQKLLDEYLLNCTRKDELSEVLNKAYETGLHGLLNNSKFIAVQSILMNASKKGVTNKVADEFENVDVTLYSFDDDGNEKEHIVKKMSSPDILLTMVKSLLIEDDYEIAKSFVQKFSLEEKVVPLLLNSEEIIMARESLKVLRETRDSYVKEAQIISELREKIKALPQLDVEGLTNQCYQFIDYLSSQTYDKEQNYYIDSIIATYEGLISNPEIDKLAKLNTSAMMMDLLDSVLAQNLQIAINEIKGINDYFYNAGLVHDFITGLNFESYPELSKKVEEFKKEVIDIMTEQNALIDEINSFEII